jgi:hypothetical protein
VQPDIDDGEIKAAALDRFKGILDTRDNRHDLMTEIHDHALDQITDEQFVLDDEDAVTGLVCGQSGHAARFAPPLPASLG